MCGAFLVALTAIGCFVPRVAHAQPDAQSANPDSAPGHRSAHSAVAIGTKIYIAGGLQDDLINFTDRFEVFDTVTNSWSAKSPIPESRYFMAACELGGKAYFIGGGQRDAEWRDTVQRYDPATDSWETLAPLQIARNRTAAVACDGLIYVIGGYIKGANTASVECFDPTTGLWSRKADMPTARHGHCAVAVDGQIYVLGGVAGMEADGMNVFEVYDPKTDSWSGLPRVPDPRLFSGAVVSDGRILAFAGHPPSPRTTACFDTRTYRWEEFSAPLPIQRGRFGYALVDHTIYLIGGEGDDRAEHCIWTCDLSKPEWKPLAQ